MRDGRARRGGEPAGGAARVLLAGAALAMAGLGAALLADDFSVHYIAEHHSRATPFPFDVATAWAALEGSIVLWVLMLAAFTAAVARTVKLDDRLGLGRWPSSGRWRCSSPCWSPPWPIRSSPSRRSLRTVPAHAYRDQSARFGGWRLGGRHQSC